MINDFTLELYLRKLAKNNYWQTIYSHVKESGSFKLFNNDHDLSSIQLDFLAYLSFYSSLYFDIAMGDVGEIVLDNEIYEDSYNYYKIKNRNKGLKKEVQKNFI